MVRRLRGRFGRAGRADKAGKVNKALRTILKDSFYSSIIINNASI